MAYTDIDKPSDYFNTVIYTGNGSGGHAITGVGFSPNFLWIKRRDASEGHRLVDSVRGATKFMSSNNNDVEYTDAGQVASLNSDGFTLGNGVGTNANSSPYVGWSWKESTVAGFDIIAYQGTGSNLDLSHNLSAVPDWIMIKNLSVDQAWRVYSKSMGFSNRLVLSENGAKSTSALGLDADPTSSVINIGTGTGTTNTNGNNYIVYAFKNVKGFSKFGSYVGNGNADGTFVYTGFKPAFVLLKLSSVAGENWYIFDNKRSPFNVMTQILFANLSNAEATGTTNIDFLSNGFKLRNSGDFLNGSGQVHIYMAFAENPFVTSTGVPATAR